ncbi:MAG: prepilin-type N-terminal cleavage/methylation domain-containing protein [Desulfomonile tiedjei]|nr:prepilin-type N-terminal cleavage/methylation domain-containing protein [Desulfomonile tiedjei]
MKRLQGFTLIECMVSLAILAFAIVGALSFFIFQSRSGFVTFKHKAAEDTVFFTQTIIARDIAMAGNGVSTHPELAVFVKETAGAPDELYLNYSGHLTLNNPDVIANPVIKSAIQRNSVFAETRTDPGYQGWLALATSGEFMLEAFPQISNSGTPVASMNSAIGAIITASGAVMDVNVKGTSAVPGPLEGTQNWRFPLVGAVATGTLVSPAVSYKWRQVDVGGGEMLGSLWRNRGDDNSPYDVPILGGDPYLDVTNFQVRCQFADGTWQTTNTSPTNLRQVEVTISYRTRGRTAYWGPVLTRTFAASPRIIRSY